MRPISEATARIAGQNFSRKYIALGRIVNCWNEIVGAELADKAQPVKIRYNRKHKHKRTEKPEAALDIAVSSADATALHYQKDLILERINQIFGERWITAIRFVTMPVSQPPLKRRKVKTPLTDAEKNSLSVMLKDIEDNDIRQRLEGLGQAIIAEERS